MTTTNSGVEDETVRIRKAMSRWKDMDAAGKKMGRGLGRRELIDRVALETGTTTAAVLTAIKQS